MAPQESSGPGQTAGTDRVDVLALFDMLGQRWALRTLWELGQGSATYRDLAARIPGMSTSVLTQRLRDLREAGLVDHEHGTGYRLTPLGGDLLACLAPLQEWAERVRFAHGPPPG